MHITSRNTNTMMQLIYDRIEVEHVKEDTRNGPVWAFPHPVILTYTQPYQRVNFCSVRDANPFFHFFEALWMLNGGRDVETVAQFAKQIAEYSDDGETFNAPYGFRIRKQWGDQLHGVITHLQNHHKSRQAVIQIWDPADLNKQTKDKACNLILVFRVIHDRLDLTIYNRSNDMIWGAVSGSNVVHFSFFMEYVAEHLNIRPGRLHTVSNNLHIYLDNPKTKPLLDKYRNKYPARLDDEYSLNDWQHYPLGSRFPGFNSELTQFMAWVKKRSKIPNYKIEFSSPFLTDVATPMWHAWLAFKGKQRDEALFNSSNIAAPDWRFACSYWLKRRYEK